MIDLKLLKEKTEEIKQNIKARNMKIDIDHMLSLSKMRSDYLEKIDKLRNRRNEIASQMKSKLEASIREKLVLEGQSLKTQISDSEEKLNKVEAKYREIGSKIPNFLDDEAPIREFENNTDIVIKKVGEPTKFSFKPKDHVKIAQLCDIVDFDTATKVSGLKFYYFKNEAVLLSLALEQYALSVCMKHGFIPMITPDIAKTEILEGIGFSPRGKESNIYTLSDMSACLVGTAEITLGGYYSDTILSEKELPIRFVGLSHCFRREAGAAGQYSKGLYRVHQFSKIEMFVYTTPDKSKEEHKKILAIEEEIFSGLKIPYHIIDTPSWDLGSPAARKFDIEAWMPGRGDGEYGEVTSASNCTDYQARSLNVKYKNSQGKSVFVHTLNGTAIAVSRAIVAILENYQNEDGSVNIPEVLQPFMMGCKKINVR